MGHYCGHPWSNSRGLSLCEYVGKSRMPLQRVTMRLNIGEMPYEMEPLLRDITKESKRVTAVITKLQPSSNGCHNECQ